jgi:HD-GYP domain-containing protein (c-di-GMP phosphodiesterase class II)
MALVKMRNVKEGMTVAKDVYSPDYRLLVREGTTLNQRQIQLLNNHGIKEVEITFDPHLQSDDLDTYYITRIKATIEKKSESEDSTYSVIKEELFNLMHRYTKYIIKNGKDGRNFEQLNKIIHHLLSKESVLEYLLMIRAIGDSSFHQAIQVFIVSIAIGIRMKLDAFQLTKLGISALLYDVGKWRIDKRLLIKSDRLKQEEYDLVKEHTIFGYMMLIENFDEDIASVALQHHERYDGSGYPYNLTNDRINIYARIISLVDVYISLINDRNYRKRYQKHEAIEFIFGSGGYLFDPEIVKHFVEVVAVFSVGCMVELNDGSVGLVKEIKNNPVGRPVIELLFDAHRNHIKERKYVDLSKELNLYIIQELTV